MFFNRGSAEPKGSASGTLSENTVNFQETFKNSAVKPIIIIIYNYIALCIFCTASIDFVTCPWSSLTAG